MVRYVRPLPCPELTSLHGPLRCSQTVDAAPLVCKLQERLNTHVLIQMKISSQPAWFPHAQHTRTSDVSPMDTWPQLKDDAWQYHIKATGTYDGPTDMVNEQQR